MSHTEPTRPCSDEDALMRYLLEGTASETGERFFEALVRAAAQALKVAGAWVTEYLAGSRTLRAFAFWYIDRYISDYQYALAGTPCKVVIDRTCLVHFPDRVIEMFPGDPDLPGLNAVSYLGIPLLAGDGSVVGHLAVLDTKPLELRQQRMR
jgi:formate hydrogenlyase transcriptional activator